MHSDFHTRERNLIKTSHRILWIVLKDLPQHLSHDQYAKGNNKNTTKGRHIMKGCDGRAGTHRYVAASHVCRHTLIANIVLCLKPLNRRIFKIVIGGPKQAEAFEKYQKFNKEQQMSHAPLSRSVHATIQSSVRVELFPAADNKSRRSFRGSQTNWLQLLCNFQTTEHRRQRSVNFRALVVGNSKLSRTLGAKSAWFNGINNGCEKKVKPLMSVKTRKITHYFTLLAHF